MDKKAVLSVVTTTRNSRGMIEARVDTLYDAVPEFGPGGSIARMHPASEFNAVGINYFTPERWNGQAVQGLYAIQAYRPGLQRLDVYIGSFSLRFLLNPGDEYTEYLRREEILLATPDVNEAWRVCDAFNRNANQGSSTPPPVTRYVGGFGNRKPDPIQGMPPLPDQPYTQETDHGSVTIDPNAPYYDPSAGESGRWVDPGEPPIDYPEYG